MSERSYHGATSRSLVKDDTKIDVSYTGPDGAVVMSSANGLVCTGFASRYRHGILFSFSSKGYLYMYQPTDRMVHTTAFVRSVVEH